MELYVYIYDNYVRYAVSCFDEAWYEWSFTTYIYMQYIICASIHMDQTVHNI